MLGPLGGVWIAREEGFGFTIAQVGLVSMFCRNVSIQVRSSSVKERAVLALSNSRLLVGLTSWKNKIDLDDIEKTPFANKNFLQELGIGAL